MPSISSVSPSLPLAPGSQKNHMMTNLCPPFGTAIYLNKVFLSDGHSCVDVQLQTEIKGDFSLVDNNLVCYRNNYFHLRGSFSLQGIGELYEDQEYPFFVETSTGQLKEIDYFMFHIGAKLFDEDRLIPLAQFTRKRDAASKKVPLPINFQPGGNLQYGAVGSEQNVASFSRLRFTSPVAKTSGRRLRDQQNHIVVVELRAKLRTNFFVTVATQISSPMVVRNKSKQNYRKEDHEAYLIGHASNQIANQSVPSTSPDHPTTVPQLNSDHSDDRTPPSSPKSSVPDLTESSSIASTSGLIMPPDFSAKRRGFFSFLWPF